MGLLVLALTAVSAGYMYTREKVGISLRIFVRGIIALLIGVTVMILFKNNPTCHLYEVILYCRCKAECVRNLRTAHDWNCNSTAKIPTGTGQALSLPPASYYQRRPVKPGRHGEECSRLTLCCNLPADAPGRRVSTVARGCNTEDAPGRRVSTGCDALGNAQNFPSLCSLDH